MVIHIAQTCLTRPPGRGVSMGAGRPGVGKGEDDNG